MAQSNSPSGRISSPVLLLIKSFAAITSRKRSRAGGPPQIKCKIGTSALPAYLRGWRRGPSAVREQAIFPTLSRHRGGVSQDGQRELERGRGAWQSASSNQRHFCCTRLSLQPSNGGRLERPLRCRALCFSPNAPIIGSPVWGGSGTGTGGYPLDQPCLPPCLVRRTMESTMPM